MSAALHTSLVHMPVSQETSQAYSAVEIVVVIETVVEALTLKVVAAGVETVKACDGSKD